MKSSTGKGKLRAPTAVAQRSTLLLLLAVVAIGTLAGCAGRTGIRGTVTPPRGTRAAQPSQLEETVVWVEQSGPAARPVAPEAAHLRFTKAGFDPAVLVVSAGALLRISNQDAVFHTPFSPAKNGGFRLEPLRPGESEEVVLAQPGEFRLFCELHSDATAVTLVLPHGVRARVEPTGRFALPYLPKGKYVVSYWHPLWGSGRRAVEVPEQGRLDVDVKF